MLGKISAMDLAKYVISKCTVKGNPISNLQLQKILYFIQINYIKNFKELLFEDIMQAWEYGPVIKEVYDEYSYYGATDILMVYPEHVDKVRNELNEIEIVLIDKIVDICVKVSPWELVKRSHKKNGPWDKVYQSGKKNDIPNDSLIEYALR